ncbi:MAG TPA: hypothetical protein ENN03_10565 [bacterium]|nr:hypothetical protein [bacterium]
MAKNCAFCGKPLTFKDSFVWESRPICKSCLKSRQQPAETSTAPGAVDAVETEKEKTEKETEVFSEEKVKKELQGWGIGLIVLGIIHLVVSKFLDPTWGIVIIVLGIANLALMKPWLFVVNGVALIAVGIMNFATPLRVLGVFQIVWGIQEFVKYGKYRKWAAANAMQGNVRE